MITKQLHNFLLAVGIIASSIGQAHATTSGSTYDLTLTGDTNSVYTDSYLNGGDKIDLWYLNLSGLDNTNPIAVSISDTINVTVNFNHGATIPSSLTRTSFSLWLSGSEFPVIDTGTSGTVTFFNNGLPGLSATTGCSTSSSLVACADFYPPNNAITFDKLMYTFTITKLGTAPDQSVTLDGSNIVFQGISPAVPEPDTYTMMFAGLGLLGWMVRR